MSPTDNLTIRIDPELKGAAERAAKAEDRTLTDFVLRAVKLRIATHCDHCGRTDRPTAGAGLSDAFEGFLAEHKGHHGLVTITVSGVDRPRVYTGRLVHNEPSQGLLLMALDFRQGSTRYQASLRIPRGDITGWQEDAQGTHAESLIRQGYAQGNDAVIRGRLRTVRLDEVTLRSVSDTICAAPHITPDQVQQRFGLPVRNAIEKLVEWGIIAQVAGGKLQARYPDPDRQLDAIRELTENIDAAQ